MFFRSRGASFAGELFVPLMPSEVRVVLLVEMCEVSELSELSPLSVAASNRRGYVSPFWNFSDAGERSGKVVK